MKKMWKVEKALDSHAREEFTVRCSRFLLKLGKRTYVMGILNLTPDSFSGDGIYKVKSQKSKIKIVDEAIKIAEKMAKDGADIIDVGGESTRPGAREISAQEERERVMPVLKKLVKKINIPISIDTSKSEVCERALDLGASIVNDVRGLRSDLRLANLIARYDAGVVLMHMKGRPRTMQKNPTYRSLISEIIARLRRSIEIAHNAGVNDANIVIDPGIGFGKATEHNLEILRRLREFTSLRKPILVGTSRKSLIGNVLGAPIEERQWGTAATVALAIANGAHIVRIHDVAQMTQVARMTDAIIYH